MSDAVLSYKSAYPNHLPDNYHEVTYWRLSDHRILLVALNLIGTVLMGLALAGFAAWAHLWHPFASSTITAPQMFLTVAMLLMTLVSHELLHGLALRYYGAKPTYGILWKALMFYATAAGHAFRRNAYVVIALAPLVGLSVLGLLLLMLPLPVWLALPVVLCAAFNVGSAVGDLWLVRVASRYPHSAYIVDEKDGLRVF
ncbi:MAG: DUF3267 domain-containing protein, partial [Anaerolineae bacterium]|nr:DUF3267 domain-containing protein [Anaerolineae bacterium]